MKFNKKKNVKSFMWLKNTSQFPSISIRYNWRWGSRVIVFNYTKSDYLEKELGLL